MVIKADSPATFAEKYIIESIWNNIRKHGYAVSTSEIDPGVSGISAPVMKGSKLIGAVSV